MMQISDKLCSFLGTQSHQSHKTLCISIACWKPGCKLKSTWRPRSSRYLSRTGLCTTPRVGAWRPSSAYEAQSRWPGPACPTPAPPHPRTPSSPTRAGKSWRSGTWMWKMILDGGWRTTSMTPCTMVVTWPWGGRLQL